MNKLYFITWNGDLTQFLAEGKTKEEAVKYAIKANKEIGWDEDEDLREMEDANTYEAEEVDFELLKELAKRTDYVFSMEHVIVYNG